MSIPKILIIPARRHVAEAYCEYLIRYLSDEFDFDMGYPPEPPYSTLKERILNRQVSPFAKNPDDYDLIYPHFDSHWFLEPREKYAHKVALVMFEPAGPRFKVAVTAATGPVTEAALHHQGHSLRFGIDTELFKPLPVARSDNRLRIGIVGNIQTPRRYNRELVVEALAGVDGIQLMFAPTGWAMHTRADEVERMGGSIVLENIIGREDIWYPGLPNIYNQFDLIIRSDIDPGYHFPILEAAACGVPVIWVDQTFCPELFLARGGILTGNGDGSWQPDNLSKIGRQIRQAVIGLRDDPQARQQMGQAARQFVVDNYTWDKFIPAWREFFREGVNNARAN